MSILEQLVKEIEQKHTSPSGTHSEPTVYGPGGLFGTPGLERDVISSRVAGIGLASALQAVPSVTMNPLYPYITGRADDVGTQSANACDDAPTAGNLLTCYQTAQFGLVSFATRELEVNKVGQLDNRGVFTDLRFVNDPLVAEIGSMFPNIAGGELGLQYGREMVMRMVEVGLSFQEYLSTKIYTATGTGNEFPGLELLVTENHYDAKTGTACDSLASGVIDFGDVDIVSAAGSAAIFNTITQEYRTRRYNASAMRFEPATFVIVMRADMYTTITDLWPCSYSSFRCEPSNAQASINLDGLNSTQMRDEMRQGSYLLIDGVKVPVIQDMWLSDTDLGDGVHSSDIYILPMTVVGGRTVLYWEHFDYNAGSIPAIRDGHYNGMFWSDQGRYLWVAKPQKNFCVALQTKAEIRIRLETPQLASRIMNVAQTLEQHWISPDRDSLYSSNTGVGTRTTDALYNEWDNTP